MVVYLKRFLIFFCFSILINVEDRASLSNAEENLDTKSHPLLLALPPELLYEIGSNLDLRALRELAQTCSMGRTIANDVRREVLYLIQDEKEEQPLQLLNHPFKFSYEKLGIFFSALHPKYVILLGGTRMDSYLDLLSSLNATVSVLGVLFSQEEGRNPQPSGQLRRVISRFPHLKALAIEGVEAEGLSQIVREQGSNLVNVEFTECDDLGKDLFRAVSLHTALKRLSLSRRDPSFEAPLISLEMLELLFPLRLQSLDLTGSSISFTGIKLFVEKLSGLRDLSLSLNSFLREHRVDLTPLSELPDLRNLTLESFRNLTLEEGRFFSALRQLRECHLSGTSVASGVIESIASSCSHLRSLWLSGRFTEQDFRQISRLSLLTDLCLSFTGPQSSSLIEITTLGNLPLEELDLSNFWPGGRLIKSVSSILTLRKLTLNATDILDSDLNYLQNLSNLEALELPGSELTIAGLKSLRESLPNLSVDLNRSSLSKEDLVEISSPRVLISSLPSVREQTSILKRALFIEE